MVSYYYDRNNASFVIEEYNQAKPFSSFLPGIAGKNGIPLWVFYINRGQCISSFGIGDKNNAIMEFFPANSAYKIAPTNGFRTFCKLQDEDNCSVYEVFNPNSPNERQNLKIQPDSFILEEETSLGLKFIVSYFILPNTDYAALVRKVTVKNISTETISFELLDGLAQVLPYGINHETVKNMFYTSRAWMTVKNLEQNIAFFKLSMSTGDRPEVTQINDGNFCLSFIQNEDDKTILKPLVDPSIIFGRDTTLKQPQQFMHMSIAELYQQKQITEGRVPCNFVGTTTHLASGDELTLYTIIGQVSDIAWINEQKNDIAQVEYIEHKEHEAKRLINSITDNIDTKTKNKIFDLYCKQTYLDNILRGGYPIVFEGEKEDKVVHVYIRKHGDQERDYNWFYLEPSYYSQGNGNYRDVNQNRRCDVSFNPKVGDFNIKTFMNLIQADGFNPLVITGTTFRVPEEKVSNVLSLVEEEIQVKEFLKQPFTVGSLIKFITINNIKLNSDLNNFITTVMRYTDQCVNAVHGEGYWIDHWTYNLDLIENYLSIYPEQRDTLFFSDHSYTFYDNFVGVKPRTDKYVVVDGKVRQYGHLFTDKKKEELIKSRAKNQHVARIEHGEGSIYRTSLFVKMLSLVLNKFATLDPYGMGVEMESEKPGWSDAMNGLPGIFGSSMPETYELQRYCEFIITLLKEKNIEIAVPVEIYQFLNQVHINLEEYFQSQANNKQYKYWDKTAHARELYRKNVFYGFKGEENNINSKGVLEILEKVLKKIKQGVQRALQLNNGLYPTYFYFNAKRYSIIKDNDGKPKVNNKNQTNVKIEEFEPHVLPIFLEGFVRALKIQKTREKAKMIWSTVRDSVLYDRKLKMYKLNAPLKDQPDEIGRAKGFTSGWLENASIWMHMEYKYLLELLNNGLYDEFYDDIKTAFIPFRDPAQYGRPTTENSSFICSSAYPDETLHGNGFYARLSGSTAEFLHIWNMMMVGKQPFFVNEDNELCLEFKPALPTWLFTEDKVVEFKFLSSCKVVYHNPNSKNTYSNCYISKIRLYDFNDAPIDIQGAVINEPYAHQIREGKIKQVDVFME